MSYQEGKVTKDHMPAAPISPEGMVTKDQKIVENTIERSPDQLNTHGEQNINHSLSLLEQAMNQGGKPLNLNNATIELERLEALEIQKEEDKRKKEQHDREVREAEEHAEGQNHSGTHEEGKALNQQVVKDVAKEHATNIHVDHADILKAGTTLTQHKVTLEASQHHSENIKPPITPIVEGATHSQNTILSSAHR